MLARSSVPNLPRPGVGLPDGRALLAPARRARQQPPSDQGTCLAARRWRVPGARRPPSRRDRLLSPLHRQPTAQLIVRSPAVGRTASAQAAARRQRSSIRRRRSNREDVPWRTRSRRAAELPHPQAYALRKAGRRMCWLPHPVPLPQPHGRSRHPRRRREGRASARKSNSSSG